MSKPASRTVVVLAVAFLVVMILGPGPGMHLVNPGPDDSGTWFGLPVLYVWAWLSFFGLATVLVIAERRIWSRSEDPEFEDGVLLDEGPGFSGAGTRAKGSGVAPESGASAVAPDSRGSGVGAPETPARGVDAPATKGSGADGREGPKPGPAPAPPEEGGR